MTAIPPYSDYIVADCPVFYYLFNESMLKTSNALALDYSSSTVGGAISMKQQDVGTPAGMNRNQHWSLISMGTGCYSLCNENSGLVMQYSNGVLSLQPQTAANPDQQWMLQTSDSGGYYYIVHNTTGLALTSPEGTNGALTLGSKDRQSALQHWLFGLAYNRTSDELSINANFPATPFDLQTTSGSYVSAFMSMSYAGPKVMGVPGQRLTYDSSAKTLMMQYDGASYYMSAELSGPGRSALAPNVNLLLTRDVRQALSTTFYVDQSGYCQLFATTPDGAKGYVVVSSSGSLILSWDQFCNESLFVVIVYGDDQPPLQGALPSSVSGDPTLITLLWQVTGAFFLTLVAPFPISQAIRANVIVILMDALPNVQEALDSLAAEIDAHPDDAFEIVRGFLHDVWRTGVIGKIVLAICSSWSYIFLGTLLGRVTLALLSPAAAVANLLIGFAIWQYQTIQAARAYIAAHKQQTIVI